MKLVKCPRCDLNYITESEKYCKVCLREMKGLHSEDELELCSICNAAPALPGKDVCLSCLKEMNGTLSDEDDSMEEGVSLSSGNTLDMEGVSDMDEIIPEEDDDDIPEEIAKEEEEENGHLSLEDLEEEEADSDEQDE